MMGGKDLFIIEKKFLLIINGENPILKDHASQPRNADPPSLGKIFAKWVAIKDLGAFGPGFYAEGGRKFF